MQELLAALLWVVGLVVAVAGAEVLVRTLTTLGDRFRFTPALLGLLIAFGADAPEVTSSLAATIGGKRDIGLGVILGSNIYNLAGLLGLSAVLAGSVFAGKRIITVDALLNLGLMLPLLIMMLIPGAHLALGLLMLVVLAGYTLAISYHSSISDEDIGVVRGSDVRADKGVETPSPNRFILLAAVLAVVLIVGGSTALVTTSTYLGPRLGIPSAFIGTFVLATATSLPNTWSAVSLARRQLAAEAISTTFNSNSINIALGIGLPSLVIAMRERAPYGWLDFGWLLGMTLVVILMLAVRPALRRWEGSLLIALYAAFVVVRLTISA